MSSAAVSPHGFTGVRGRGYRPEQVDGFVAGLSDERDGAWERAARLTVLMKEMEADSAALAERVAGLAPQTYETLGERARTLIALVTEEAAGLHSDALAAAQLLHEEVGAAERTLRDAARADADAALAAAEAHAQQVLAAAQGTSEELRIGSRKDAKLWRAEALGVLREMRERTAAALAELEKEHGERADAADRELAARESDFDARHADLIARAEARLAEAHRVLAATEESARHGQEDADARAAELIAHAGVRAERTERETERVLRENGEAQEELRAHMSHVRSSLASLTGKATAADGS
ncbi:cellulose-binding protein [Streptomyces sp. NBC_00859]|uniref:cellulose-binding protein n=1 Tax=Streptomyces sp. NBC_00859 TaxID=2903682 RepID=UPI003868B306|nr:cellulose-binding protein [Streptomyces sp. NBC_00859]